MPATVQFREAIKQSDGTYKQGETMMNLSGITVHRMVPMIGAPIHIEP